MNNNVNQKLEEVLRGIDKNKIINSKKTIEQLANSPEGKKLLNNIGNVDKSKIMNMFMKMDTNEIKKKLNSVDLSKLSGLKAEDIINKLK